jgi:hypothetical protein
MLLLLLLLLLLQSVFEKGHQASLRVYDDPPTSITYPGDGL